MFVLKISLGLLVVYVCVLIAKSKADKYKNQYLFYSSLCDFCKDFEINLTFNKLSVKQMVKKRYKSNEFNSVLDGVLHSESLELPTYLSSKEISDVTKFFSDLGVTDTASQLLTVKNYKNIFCEAQASKNSEYKKYYSVFIKIGFSIGFMIMVMVI